jgi:hypothetical protein
MDGSRSSVLVLSRQSRMKSMDEDMGLKEQKEGKWY